MANLLKSILVTGIAFSVMTAPVNGATTLNVDFGQLGSNVYSGLGAAPDLGTQWNGLDWQGGSNLLYSDGVPATGISVSTTAGASYDDGGNALVGDRIFERDVWGAFDVTISGLTDGLIYDLYIYGSNTSYASTYTVDSTSDYALGYINDYPFVYHNNYALLSQVKPTNGQININVDRYAGSSAAVIAGFQLQESISSGVGGTLTKMISNKGTVTCQNMKTKQKIVFPLTKGSSSWDCGANGLIVKPKEIIKQTISVTGPAN